MRHRDPDGNWEQRRLSWRPHWDFWNKVCRKYHRPTGRSSCRVRAGISESTFYTWEARAKTEHERLNSNPRAAPCKSDQQFMEFFHLSTRARRLRWEARATVGHERLNSNPRAAPCKSDQQFMEFFHLSTRARRFRWEARAKAEHQRLNSNPRAAPRKSDQQFMQFLDTITRARRFRPGIRCTDPVASS